MSNPTVRNTLPGADDTLRAVLPNGITVLTRANHSSPSVVVHGYVDTGALRDPQDKLGLADFTASMLTRGTQTRTFHQIFDLLESSGASLGYSGNTHTTSFTGRSLIEDLPMLLALLRETSETPTFPAEYVEKMRAQLLTGLALRAQDTSDMASLTFDRLLYRDHPYGRPDDGYPETVARIFRDDLADYHAKHFGPRGMVLVIVGDVEPARAVDLVNAAFGSWQNPQQSAPVELPVFIPPTVETREHAPVEGMVQSDIVMGGSGPTRKSPDHLPISLGNNVLGQFGMYGRIGEVVRERSGLAYYAYTRLNSGVGPGTWEVSAGVNPANVEKTIALVKQEIARYLQKPVDAEELSDSQANYIGRLPLAMESNSGVASALLHLERYQLSLDYYREYAGLVRAVTSEMILEASRRYLDPRTLAIASAGPTG
jgi:zinc protease